jgi:oxygen-dependent protoporphyrinogen oxidase
MARIVIVGGGLSGLSLAYRLEQRWAALEAVVLEQQTSVGGTISTLERDGFRIEAGPNGFLDTNPATRDLCLELGLADRLIPASEESSRNRFVLLGGHLHRLPNSFLSFLTTDVVSWTAKLNVLVERFRPRRVSAADESIDSFVRRRVGNELATTLADAFVTGIFAGDPKLLSVQAALPRLAAFERDHGSILRGMAAARRQRKADAPPVTGASTQRAGQMWSFREGLQVLVATLRQRLRGPVLSGVQVRRVQRQPEGWRVSGEGQEGWSADAVALTCPAWRQAELLADVDGELAAQVGSIPYNRVAVVALGYPAAAVPHRLDGFGYLSPQRERRDVLGVQWCSSIFPGRAPSGQVLLRALCGGWNRPEIVDWPDDHLLAAVRAELGQVLRIEAAPSLHQIVRWERAIPQYHVGHLDRVAWIEDRLLAHPGLYLGGNAYRGVAMNDCVEQAGRLAERISRSLAV